MKGTLVAALVALVLAAGAGRALADGPFADDRRAARTLAGPGLSLDEAVARAERRHGARAVRADERRQGERIVYRIRLLGPDGRVFDVTVDATTGDEL